MYVLKNGYKFNRDTLQMEKQDVIELGDVLEGTVAELGGGYCMELMEDEVQEMVSELGYDAFIFHIVELTKEFDSPEWGEKGKSSGYIATVIMEALAYGALCRHEEHFIFGDGAEFTSVE